MRRGEFGGRIGPRRDPVGPDLEALRERFWRYTPKDRNHERRGILQWRTLDEPPNERRQHANLHIPEHPEHGFAVLWFTEDEKSGEFANHYTLGDPSKLTEDHWIDAADEEWVLAGNFVPLAVAWAVIEDFFADPMTLSPRAEWISTTDMPEFPI